MQDFYKAEISCTGSLTLPPAKNSAAFAKADPVTIDSNGVLIVATAGDKVMGYAMEDFTAASDNETVAKKYPKCAPARGQLMVYTSDQACTQTDVGAYADLTGTAGAIQINLLAGTSGQFIVRNFDPDRDGSTTKVVVMASEVQDDAYAQA